jgi:hypothetical protein
MDAVDDATRAQLIAAGSLQRKYSEAIDRESAHEMITARLEGAAETVSGAEPPAAPLPPPPGGPAPGTTTAPKQEQEPKPAPKPEAKSRARPKAEAGSKGTRTRGSDGGLADDVKDIGVGFAKDMLTTADGRRTLRTVFGALFGRK